MTKWEIETFFAVFENATITAAAEALFISQPTLTARLHSLEKEIGAPLFIRGKGQRKTELTEAGRRFLPLARRWRNLLRETKDLAASAHRELLHIIAVYTANQYILPPVYERFLSKNSSVSLWVETLRHYEAISFVGGSDADFAIVDSLSRYESRIEAVPLFRESFCLLLSPDYLDTSGPIAPRTLCPEQELLISAQDEILQWHNKWFGSEIRPLLYTDLPQLIEQIPIYGKRWAVVPAASAAYFKDRKKGRICRLTEPPAERIFYLVTRKGEALSNAAVAFLHDLRAHTTSIDGIYDLQN
ncbi:MAG: LysR family transcriptional regulator [Lachnospiraceae bacterium]|nr:LysR family transcriptional regulator [Lachnospiraceae bacterium]